MSPSTTSSMYSRSSVAGAEPVAEAMVRTASTDSAILAHPKPDLQTTQGAYIGNVERLEESAERLSIGSNIGEEIRRLQLEQKMSESARSSLHIDSAPDIMRNSSQRSRGQSYSSHNNSIVDVNQAARWGGYSPAAYVGSPVGSITSGSWSQPSLQRQRSASKTTRLGTVAEPESPGFQGSEFASPHGTIPPQLENADVPDQSSFVEELHAIAQDIQGQFYERDTVAQDGQEWAAEAQQEQQPHLESPIAMDIPDRPPTAASNNTYHQAQTMFTDFDGVHYAAGSRVTSGILEGDTGSRRVSTMSIHPPPQRETWAQPPPDDGMVFYPAPVPRMLNLPQRLSQRPAAAVQAKRRDKVISRMAPQDKQAAPWLDKPPQLGLGPQFEAEDEDEDVPLGVLMSKQNGSNARHSQANLEVQTTPTQTKDATKAEGRKGILKNMAGLPPQLRATMFFDAQPRHQEVEVKNDSAIVTLDSVLEASASLPADAFTDHPFSGHEGAKIYKREAAPQKHMARRSTTSILNVDKAEARKSTSSLRPLQHSEKEVKKRRSSFGLLFGKRSHSTIEVETMETLRNLQNSRLTMRTKSDIHYEQVPGHSRNPSSEAGEDAPLHDDARASGQYGLLKGGDDDEEDDVPEVPQEEEEVAEEEEDNAPPTTLLAELQKRKAQLKSRNRTAATAFPNGMHSTLLEMDAVAQVEQKRRIKKRIALAWEDPGIKAEMEAENEDDDVPLGMLFTKQNGVVRRVTPGEAVNRAMVAEADLDRPLGLIEQRDMEDNEPLSKRRNRLKGIAPQTMTKRNTGFGVGPLSSSQLHLPFGSQVNLAQPGSGGASPKPNEENEEEGETLGQRARRLRTKSALDNAIGDAGSRPLSSAFSSELLGQFGVPEAQPGVEADALQAENPTPDPEETLGQRRARLQAQAQQAGSRPMSSSSQQLLDSRPMSSGSQQLLNANRMSSSLLPSPQQPEVDNTRSQSGLGLAGVRSSRSMADLLAAHPLTATAHTARKVSDEMLTNSMPAGSLLAQQEVLSRRNQKRLSSANALGSGALRRPLVEMDRKSSGGMEFGRGMLGAREQERLHGPMQQPQMMPQGGMTGYGMDPMSMQMNGVSMNGGAMGGMNGMAMGGMGMGMGMSMPHVQSGMMSPGYPNMGMNMPFGNPQAQMMGYPPQTHMGMGMSNGMMSMGIMQNPMGMLPPNTSQQSFGPPQATTYAAFAQQQMNAANQATADPAGLKPEQRNMIDQWRQSVLM